MSKRDLATLDRDICQPLGRILHDLGADGWANSEHLKLETSDDEKNVRINSRDYTYDCTLAENAKTFTAMQTKPNVTVGGYASVVGFEASPRFASGIAGVALTGILSNPLFKGLAGDLSDELRAYEGKLESPSGSTRVITGPASILKAGQALHGTVTNGVFIIDADAAGGNTAWTGVLNLPADDQLAKYRDGGYTPGNCDGQIVVYINDVKLYVPAYDAMSDV